MGFSTISTPQCGDQEKKAGSGAEVVTYYAESIHLISFSAVRSDSWRANQCSTWRPCEWLPLITPHIGGIEWANNHEWGNESAERASDPRERAMDLAGEDEDRARPSHSLCQIQLRTPRMQPPLHLNVGGASNARNAGEGSLLEENPPGAKCTQW